MKTAKVLTVFLITGVLMEATTSLPISAWNRQYKREKEELDRQRRALPVVAPIIWKLGAKGAKFLGGGAKVVGVGARNVAAYCRAQPMCCIESVTNAPGFVEKVWDKVNGAFEFLNLF